MYTLPVKPLTLFSSTTVTLSYPKGQDKSWIIFCGIFSLLFCFSAIIIFLSLHGFN